MKRLPRHIVVAVIVIVAMVAVLVLAVTAADRWTTSLSNVAKAGQTEAETGARRLAARDATGAASSFHSAAASFESADRMLGPAWLGSVLGATPFFGRQYTTARSLAAIGLDASSAGSQMAQALRETSSSSAAASSTGAFRTFLVGGRPHIDSALASLRDAASRAETLSGDGLVPPLAKAVMAVKSALRPAAPLLGRSQELLSLGAYLAGAKHRFLVVSQDGAELRPTGGFMGSYAVIEVGPNGVRLEKYSDIYNLPDPPGIVQPPPGAKMTQDFGLRDANWWIDFPTSARRILGFWRDYGQTPVDGVIAVDTVAMSDLLEVLGPVAAPEYGETFTAKNLLDRLLYVFWNKLHGSPGRKDVLVELANQLEKRLLAASPGDLARSALALARAADAKHVQIYLSDPGAQAAVAAAGWSGRIAAPTRVTDLLAVSNALNVGTKVNIAMKKTMAYDVALKPDRSAETTLVLRYANTGPYTVPVRNVFYDYLRVYRAPGTVFTSNATSAPGENRTAVELGLPTAIRTFAVARGQHHEEVLTSRITTGAWQGGGNAPRYRLFVVRQADLQDIPTTVSITVPDGWRVSTASARLTASGDAIPVAVHDTSVRLAAPLSGDVMLDIVLAPSR